MRRLAGNEHKTVAGIPKVVGLAIVSVEPTSTTIAIHIEQVRIAIGVVYIQSIFYTTTF
ncbi:hypothetical protein L6255_02640 [Candidatus Parcubacteria bacterium]|nr:hypothetical protein [Patescibacteria group bacterium]MBU4381003.1 hypothetical protein [Patescibacteria group bacterium]MCG2689314.1 hypothetical protein [Candidatus Parcubacteria bacterium]